MSKENQESKEERNRQRNTEKSKHKQKANRLKTQKKKKRSSEQKWGLFSVGFYKKPLFVSNSIISSFKVKGEVTGTQTRTAKQNIFFLQV